jgi:hypothetical protein
MTFRLNPKFEAEFEAELSEMSADKLRWLVDFFLCANAMILSELDRRGEPLETLGDWDRKRRRRLRESEE